MIASDDKPSFTPLEDVSLCSDVPVISLGHVEEVSKSYVDEDLRIVAYDVVDFEKSMIAVMQRRVT